uniref:4-hydroxy-tetrahydrodipicolinate synthase n=1 Tax=Megaviridae environmental sample TaxID=1737588 RepID=A0A5J6VJA9_9VIRU|nr:MAG: dihydrodipicolinate synthetase family protein [Megaviridae environmental sample]
MKLITAIKTPFNKYNRIDLNAFSNLLSRQIESGINAVVIAGTTGEGHLLNQEERTNLIDYNVRNFDVNVIANVGSNSTGKAIRATRQAFDVGADYALQVNPYYGKVCNNGMYHHLAECTKYGPTIMYNVPSRTGQDLPIDVVKKLSKLDNFYGIKECHSIERMQEYKNMNINMWCGNDEQTPIVYNLKNDTSLVGAISVISNIVPEFSKSLVVNNDIDLKKNTILCDWLFQKPNPIGVNTALAMMGYIKPVFRMPYLPLNESERKRGKYILEEYFNVEGISLLKDEDFVILKA